MSSVTRQTTLPTQVFAGLHSHPKGVLKTYPYPSLAPERKVLRSAVVVAVQSGFTNAVHLAFGKSDAATVLRYPDTMIRLGDPQDEVVPIVAPHKPLTLNRFYADFFKRLHDARTHPVGSEQGLMFTDPLPAGIWLALAPEKGGQPYGIMSITNGKGVNKAILFPSKDTGMRLLSDWDELYHGDVPKQITECALPEISPLNVIELTGDLADWIIALEFLTRK